MNVIEMGPLQHFKEDWICSESKLIPSAHNLSRTKADLRLSKITMERCMYNRWIESWNNLDWDVIVNGQGFHLYSWKLYP